MALIINPTTGEIVFTEDPTALYQQGYRDPTAEELDHSARVEEFGGFEQQAQAQVERVVRGATFGAVEGFGTDEENRARADVSEELSPVTSFAASVVPDLAVAAASGGLGGLATGAGRAAGRAALAEGAGLVRAGLSAARAGGAAALGAESVATGLVGAGQSAYAEGREFEDDPGRFAEDALIWGGLNLGLGAFALRSVGRETKGAIDETIGAADNLDDIAKSAEFRAERGAASAIDETTPIVDSEITYLDGGQPSPFAPADDLIAPAGAVREGEREATEGGVERALRNASKADADDLIDSALGSTPVPEADGFGRQRRLYINREVIYDVAEREMARDLGGLMEDVGQVARVDKAAAVARNVSENLPAQRAVAQGIAKDAAQFVGELRAEARAYGKAAGKQSMQYAIPAQKSLALALMDNAKELQGAKNGRELFERLDNFKRAAQDYKLSLESGALNSSNPIHHQKLIPRVDAFAQKIRVGLENAGVWGKAGEMQRAYNGVISDRLMPHMRTFEEAVLQRTFKGYDGVWKTEGWETKIRSLLKDANPGNRRHVGSVLDAMDELASVRRQFGDPKMAERIEKQTAKVRRTIGLADEVGDATERMKAIGEIVGGVPYGGAIAGGLAGGLPGAAIGAVLPGAVRGFVMGDLISAFQRLSGATEQAAQRGVDDWIRSSKMRGSGLKGIRARLPRLPDMSSEAKQLRDVAARRGVSQSMALFMGEDESPGAAFERWRDVLLDQEKFFEAVGQDYNTLKDEAPEVFMAVAARADVSRRFLVERMPPNVAVSMAHPEGYSPSRDSIEDWSRYVNAVRFPARVAQNIGGATMQEVETLRTTAPRMYEQVQQRTLEGMYRAQQHGEPLDDVFLARVAIIFPELDGAGSPVFSKEFGKTILDYNDRQKKQGPGGGGGGGRKPSPSPMQATIEAGATFGTGFA